MKWPTIRDVACALRAENRAVRDASAVATNLEFDDANDFVDIRLQVYPDGEWALRSGDSSYDADHRGFWGAGSLDGKRFDSRELARDLIEQCKDQHAQDATPEEIRAGQTELINAERARLDAILKGGK